MADEEKNETIEEPTAMTEVSDTGVVSDTSDAVTPDATEEVSDTDASSESAPESDVVSDTGVVSDTSDAATPDATEEVSDTDASSESAPESDVVSDTKKKRRSLKHVPRTARRTRSKLVREKPATRKSITRTEKPESELGRRQERRGVVISDKGDKTIIVKVDVIKSHPKYQKVIRRTAKFHAHDEANTAGIGDTVRIVETRPLSKTKRWRLAEIVEKAR